MAYIIDPPRQAALPIKGTDKLFPIHRVYCIGRNYAEHAREMGHDPNREPPFFFQKNQTIFALTESSPIRPAPATCITKSRCWLR